MSTHPKIRRITLFTCIGLTAVLAGCGAGAGEDQASGNPNDGPLGELFGWNVDPTEQRAKDLEREETVAVCMREAGYEYTPVDYQAQQPEGADEQWTNPEEFGKKYGYGIVFNYNLYERPNEDGTSGQFSGNEFIDPNNDYVTGLSQSEQEAYYTALYGDQSGFEEPVDESVDTVFVAPPIEEQGCSGKAQQQVYGEDPFSNPDMSARLDEIFSQMESDPRIEDANRAWSDCMYEIDGNWDFAQQYDTYQYFETRKYQLQGLRRVEVDPQTGDPLDPLSEGEYLVMSMTDEDTGESFGYVGEPKPISEADLDEIQKEEIDMWTADQGCLKDAKIVEIRKDVEQELVDQLVGEFPELSKKGE
jgi:hypothetical protein